MNSFVKKVCYLREDQVERLLNLTYASSQKGKRRLSESLLCRVAIDLLFSLDLDIEAFSSEEELLKACKTLVIKRAG